MKTIIALKIILALAIAYAMIAYFRIAINCFKDVNWKLRNC